LKPNFVTIITNKGNSLVNSSLKIVIPMAGYGVRLRPHTWSRPKQLIRLADKLVIDHVLDIFATLPDPVNSEFIFIVGYLGKKIEDYMRCAHPNLKVRFVEQPEMWGQSHAISLASKYLDGPMLVFYADTLIETDFSFLRNESADAVTWVKAVSDPSRFGVASLGEGGWVNHLIEKPQKMNNKLALAGGYYFQRSDELLLAIKEQMDCNIRLNNEFFLADAVNIMLKHGLKMRVESVDIWLDAGTPSDVLNANYYLLEHGHDNSVEASSRKTTVILPPVYIHPSAMIKNSIIGPHTTIGTGCKIQSCIISDCIIDDGSIMTDMILEHSLIGQEVHIEGKAGVMNVGDQIELSL
jgi:glucose-1-phosphate thymidylyltransferase